MERPRLSRGEVGFMVGVPIAWAVLLLFHPDRDNRGGQPSAARTT